MNSSHLICFRSVENGVVEPSRACAFDWGFSKVDDKDEDAVMTVLAAWRGDGLIRWGSLRGVFNAQQEIWLAL